MYADAPEQYIIMNLGMAEQFQTVEAALLQFPGKMYVDYVRVYQRDGEDNIGCEPDGHPTQDYINKCVLFLFICRVY